MGSPPHQVVYIPVSMVPTLVTASCLLVGNREAVLKPTTFSIPLLFCDFLSFLFSWLPQWYITFECCLLVLLFNNNIIIIILPPLQIPSLHFLSCTILIGFTASNFFNSFHGWTHWMVCTLPLIYSSIDHNILLSFIIMSKLPESISINPFTLSSTVPHTT